MGALILGTLVLLFFLLLLRWFLGADPRALIKGLRYSGAILLFAAAIGLAALDRVGLAMLAGSFAWALLSGGRAWPGGWPYGFSFGRSRQTRGDSSQVQTDWLDMALDHETGEMEGSVRKGGHAGMPLASLTKSTLMQLYLDITASDPQSERLLAAYLQRRFGPGWHSESDAAEKPSDSGMSRAEAYRILGLEPDADEAEIRAAHRRLILQNHPDKGGSSYLASKINEAKDVLLGS